MGKERLGKANPLGNYHKKQALKQKLKMKEKMGVRKQFQEMQKQQQQEKVNETKNTGQNFDNQFQLPLYRKDGNIAAIDPTAIDENPDILNDFLSQFHKENKKNKKEEELEEGKDYLDGVEFPEMQQINTIQVNPDKHYLDKVQNHQIEKSKQLEYHETVKKQQSEQILQTNKIPRQSITNEQLQQQKLKQEIQVPQYQQLQQQLPQQILQQQSFPQLPELPELPQFPKLPQLPELPQLNYQDENEKIEKKIKKQQMQQQLNTFDPFMMNTFNKKQEVQFLNKTQYDYYQQQYAQQEQVEQQGEYNEPDENYIIKQATAEQIKPVIERDAELKIKKIDVTKEKVQFVPRCLKVPASVSLKKQEYKQNKLNEFLNDINNLY